MADDPRPAPDLAALVPELLDRIRDTTYTIRVLQAFVLTLVQYQREQPGYDDARFRALYAEQRARVQVPEAETSAPDPAMQALLKAFEGPPQ